MKNYLLDSNLIIRIITNDDLLLTTSAKQIFEKAKQGEFKLTITPMVVAECLYVLTSKNLYKISRDKAVVAMQVIFNQKNIYIQESKIIIQAIELFATTKLDFADCYLISKKEMDNFDGIYSFDKSLMANL